MPHEATVKNKRKMKSIILCYTYAYTIIMIKDLKIKPLLEDLQMSLVNSKHLVSASLVIVLCILLIVDR